MRGRSSLRTGYRTVVFEHEITLAPVGDQWNVTVKDQSGDIITPTRDPDLQITLDQAKSSGCRRAIVAVGMQALNFDCTMVVWTPIQLPS